MLSRVAERTYWIGRYLERAENLARLYNVFGRLFLDLPSSTGLGWIELVRIIGAGDALQARHSSPDERTVIDFLLADADNPVSLLWTLSQARENARTTRDILPSEAWLTINRLYLDMRQRAQEISTPAGRNEALTEIVGECQKFDGLISGTMSHDDGYRFIRIGSYLERAEMTSRTLDAAIAMLLANREELDGFNNTLWMAVLKSVSGYQMYRQSVRRRVTSVDVIRYLFSDPQFPRSMQFCLQSAGSLLAQLPRHQPVLNSMQTAMQRLQQEASRSTSRSELHDCIDSLQIDIAAVHTAIARNWFEPDSVQ